MVQPQKFNEKPHLKSDAALFLGVLSIVLIAVIGLAVLNQRTGQLDEFGRQIYHWLID